MAWLCRCQCTYAANITIVCTLWYLLRNENARRDALAASAAVAGGKADGEFDDCGYVLTADENGAEVRTKVDKGLLDLTDRCVAPSPVSRREELRRRGADRNATGKTWRSGMCSDVRGVVGCVEKWGDGRFLLPTFPRSRYTTVFYYSHALFVSYSGVCL
jgi:hypothetical protein